MKGQIVFILSSYSRGIHGVYESLQKAEEAKIEEDYDLGCSGSNYSTFIQSFEIK